MRAAIVAVGSELLGTDRLDTNSLRLTEVLERHGVELRRKVVVGDDREEIAEILRRLASEHDLVLVTGGLGPTADDVTREAAADALGRTLTLDEGLVLWLEERFRTFGRKMPAVNRRQAMVPDGEVEVLTNRRGSAPGLRFDHDFAGEGDGSGKAHHSTLFLFPGVPTELEGMIEADFEPWIAERSGGERRERVVLKTAGLPESEVEERIAPAYEEFGREAITVLAGAGEVQVRGVAGGTDAERAARLAAIEARLAELLGAAVYAHRDESLETAVARLLTERGLTLVTAESCTGGLLAERLTRVPGSSAFFLGGVVSYSNALKRALLGVPEALLVEHGAVSEPVARAMAEGARERLGADWAVAITGVAGPDGGSDEKPVGTVDLSWAGPDGETFHRRRRFLGDRERIRDLSALVGLETLRRRLLE